MFKGKKILVVGASGFIGSRLIERLCFEHGDSEVYALVKDFSKISRIAIFSNLRIINANVLNDQELINATKNIDIAFYCVYGNSGSTAHQRIVNTKGLENVLKACLRNEVKRIVYLSTVSVYGNRRAAVIDETAPVRNDGSVYASSKIEAERIAHKYVSNFKLPIVIIQPTMVYGPYSPNWTIKYIDRLKNNQLYLIDGGGGLCNPVYIDNLIDAMFLCAFKDNILGKTYIISDNSALTWRNFYNYYMEIVGVNEIPDFNSEFLIKLKRKKMDLFFNLRGIMRSILKSKDLRRELNNYELIFRTKEFIKLAFPKNTPINFKQMHSLSENLDSRQLNSILADIPDIAQIKSYGIKTTFSISKAKKELGYNPRISIVEGMQKVKEWYYTLY